MELKATVTTKGAIFQGKAPAIIRQERDAFLSEVVAFLEAEVKKRTPVGVFGGQGGLLAGIHGEVKGAGTPVAYGVVAHQSKYGDVIEYGRRAGQPMPPPGSLVRWLEVRLGLGEAQAARIEYVVRRKIARKGFEGKHMFEKALSDNMSKINSMADRHGMKISVRLNHE